jgi:biopolymer transport protein TolR
VRQRRRKRLMSEINVVPYIDVMLVLLVIFMITAPLITQGVKVDLPEARSEVISAQEQAPLIVSVDAAGRFYINYGDDPDRPVDRDVLVTRINALLRHQPGMQVLVEGDKRVEYARVIELMALLQGAGAPSVGLMTEPLDR